MVCGFRFSVVTPLHNSIYYNNFKLLKLKNCLFLAFLFINILVCFNFFVHVKQVGAKVAATVTERYG